MINRSNPNPELEQLFDSLNNTPNRTTQKEIEEKIWQIWMDHPEFEVRELFERGNEAIQDKDYGQAIRHFSHVIALDPNFTEAWNKRATAYFLRGEYKASLKDIHVSLSQEPRHFGALSGKVSILVSIGDFKGALNTLNRLIQIFPFREDLKKNMKVIREQMEARKF